MSGPQFFNLHTKFEEFYNEAAWHIDELAERILASGGKPIATMSDYLAHASVTEADGTESAEQMVQAIINEFCIMIGELKAGMEVVQEADDGTTSDLLLGIHTEMEKHVWMLTAFLGK